MKLGGLDISDATIIVSGGDTNKRLFVAKRMPSSSTYRTASMKRCVISEFLHKTDIEYVLMNVRTAYFCGTYENAKPEH